MTNKKEQMTSLGIEHGSIFLKTIGAIGALTSIVMAIIYFNLIYVIISVLTLIIIFLVVYLVASINQLRAVRKEYNKLIEEYNFLIDNRDTLKDMIEDKNHEFEKAKASLDHKNFIINFLLRCMYSSEFRRKLEKDELSEVLQLENE